MALQLRGVVDPVLRGVILGKHNPVELSLTGRALRRVPVQASTGRILKVGQGGSTDSIMGRNTSITAFRVSSESGYPRLYTKLTDAALYSTDEYALAQQYSAKQARELAAGGGDLGMVTAQGVLQQLITARDGATASLLLSASTTAASGNWGSSSVDPGVDVDAVVEVISNAIGAVDRRFIKVAMRSDDFNRTLRNPRYRGALTSDGGQPRRLMGAEDLARELNVGEVVVDYTRYNSAAEGATDSGAQMWTAGYVAVYYDPPDEAGLIQPPAFRLYETQELTLYTHQPDPLHSEVTWHGDSDWVTVNSTSARVLTGIAA